MGEDSRGDERGGGGGHDGGKGWKWVEAQPLPL